MDTIADILSNGNMEDILKFLKEKNIRDSKIFNFNDIM